MSHFQSNACIVQTNYTSKPVDIPADFLKATPPDATPITVEKIDFSTSPLPEYAPCYATVLDNVLSTSECTELLRLAVESSPQGKWEQAMVNVGIGREILAPEFRLCERIIWDNSELVERIWERCLLAPGIREELRHIRGQPKVQGQRAVDKGVEWEFSRLNERMRFLKYGAGQYFKQHCDGTYVTPSCEEVSFYTLHLYLNDSVAAGGEVEGGATTFHSKNMKRSLNVDPKMGRVLIFQHAYLLHSGQEVQRGVKYTMRTDLMYRRKR